MSTAANTPAPGVVRSLIPARLDRLPWSPFHTRMVVALGVAWILDGLEITVASAVADTPTQPETLGLSSAAVGLVASVYLAGEVVGALFFGRLSDKLAPFLSCSGGDPGDRPQPFLRGGRPGVAGWMLIWSAIVIRP